MFQIKVFVVGYLLVLFLMVNTTHPMVFSLMLVLLAFVVSVIFYLMISVWLFYTVMLVFLGGMMVLFLYVSMLSNEDKVTWSLSSHYSVASVTFLAFFFTDSLCKSWNYSGFNLSELSDLYSSFSVASLSMLVGYLLITLFTTMKFTEGFKGTMVKSSWS